MIIDKSTHIGDFVRLLCIIEKQIKISKDIDLDNPVHLFGNSVALSLKSWLYKPSTSHSRYRRQRHLHAGHRDSDAKMCVTALSPANESRQRPISRLQSNDSNCDIFTTMEIGA